MLKASISGAAVSEAAIRQAIHEETRDESLKVFFVAEVLEIWTGREGTLTDWSREKLMKSVTIAVHRIAPSAKIEWK